MAQYSLSIDAVALVAATAKTIFELGTASTEEALIKEWWVDFDGATSTAVPGRVEVGRASAAVTTATTGTPEKHRAAAGAATATVKHSTSTEGAGTMTPWWNKRIHPQGGSFHYQAIQGSELIVAVSTFFRIRCTFAANVNVTFGCVWEE